MQKQWSFKLPVEVQLGLSIPRKIMRKRAIGFLAAALMAGMAASALAQRPVTSSTSALSDTKTVDKQGDFYVATDGKDTWSGTMTAPRADGTDGPFATLARARDAVRAARAKDTAPRAYTVMIRGGFYSLEKTLVFTPEDSTTASAPTIYAAWPGEKPVLSGGRRVTGWQKSAEGNTWTAVIPEVCDGKWYSTQLFVNDQRRTRARIPNEGILRSYGPPSFSQEVLKAVAGRDLGKGVTGNKIDRMGMSYKDTDIQRWENLDDVNLHVMHAWTGAIHWIADLDEQRRTVLYTGPSRFPSSNFERQMPYFIENVREGLDSPGEWYLDRKTGVLTYWPVDGEDITAAEAVVSALQTLVRFTGVATEGKFVDGLIFRGLSFQYADWGPLNPALENDGYSGCHFLEAAVHAEGLRYSVFEKCEILRSGGYALYLINGSTSNRVQQCEIHDMGGGGILIGSRFSYYDDVMKQIPPDDAPDALICRYNVVENCFFHDNGQIFSGVLGGVFIAHSSYNKVTHNEICNMPYSGVTVGRRMDYKYSHTHHNEVAWNHIHHLGRGSMSDMAGIYTEGLSPGTRLHHNLIHDVNRYRYGGWGLYCDEGSQGILLDHNIVYGCIDGCYMQNVGSGNILSNNIFLLGTENAQLSTGKKRHPDAGKDLMTVERNIIATSTGEILARFWSKEDALRFDRNIYWTTEGKELRFKDWSLDQWHGMGQDRHSIIADPLFVNAASGDFGLKPDSPALTIGFEPIDIKKIGLYGDPEWVSAPSKIPAQGFKKITPPPPDTFKNDFELTPLGAQAEQATTFGETANTSIRVTNETAMEGGEHSLKFVDGPADKAHWPFLSYSLVAEKGKARLSFDLRMGRDAVLQHEWRNKATPYAMGPSIRFENDGEVKAGGMTVAHYPLDQWFHVEISCTLGDDTDARFTLTLSAPGQPSQAVEGLEFRSGKDFNTLNWLGWMGGGVKPAVFYMDNLLLIFDPLAQGEP